MLIGIVGTHGAGKGAVVQLLKEHGFVHCSARELFLEELRKQNIPADRDSISAMARELRTKFGVAHVIDTYIKQHDPATVNVVIESIYTEGEADRVREIGGYVLAVDADPDIRYDRIVHRMSETDKVSKEEFLRKQEEESRSTDPVRQNARTVMEQADFTVHNEGTFEDLKVQVEYILEKINAQE